jgi:hypothetical protein
MPTRDTPHPRQFIFWRNSENTTSGLFFLSNLLLRLMIGCMLESKLALGCAVHLAAGLGCFDYVDLDPHINPEAEPFTVGPEFKSPYYTISDEAPGIGILKRI